MKVLFIASAHPARRVKGYQTRADQQIRRLAAEHSVSLLCFGDPAAAPDELDHLCDAVHVVPEPRAERWLRMLAAAATAEPLQTAFFRSRAMEHAIRRAVADGGFDAVVVQMSRMGGYAELLPAEAIAVLDLVDSMGLSMAQRAAASAPPMRWLWRWEGRKAARYERSLLRRFDSGLVVSTADRDHLGAADLLINPIGVDLDRFSYTRDGRADARILFVGNMQYYANIDAATYLANEVLPRVRQRVPEASLVIVGADPSREVRELGERPGITVTGFVPEVAPYLASATIGVFPMRVGSGMQNKVLEAMASGLPVVTTPKVLAGVRATPGEQVLVGSNAAELADRASELLLSPETRDAMARRGRALVEREYTWDRSVRGLVDAIRSAQQRRARHSFPGEPR